MSKREAKAEAVAAYKAAKARGASDEDAIMAAALASRWSASEIAREIARERVRERTREITGIPRDEGDHLFTSR